MSEPSETRRRLYIDDEDKVVRLDAPALDAPRFELVEVVRAGQREGWAVIDHIVDNPAGDSSFEIVDSRRQAERRLAQRLRRDA